MKIDNTDLLIEKYKKIDPIGYYTVKYQEAVKALEKAEADLNAAIAAEMKKVELNALRFAAVEEWEK